ncbi:MAG: hypothetical protein ACI92E_001618 [Oceanicoccus sp.]|jgi:hypothetical protein
MKFYRKSSFRTIFIALFATGTFVGSAIFVFDVEAKLMLTFFVICVVAAMLIIGAAFVFTVLRVLLQRWINR